MDEIIHDSPIIVSNYPVISMENTRFIDDFPISTSIYRILSGISHMFLYDLSYTYRDILWISYIHHNTEIINIYIYTYIQKYKGHIDISWYILHSPMIILPFPVIPSSQKNPQVAPLSAACRCSRPAPGRQAAWGAPGEPRGCWATADPYPRSILWPWKTDLGIRPFWPLGFWKSHWKTGIDGWTIVIIGSLEKPFENPLGLMDGP